MLHALYGGLRSVYILNFFAVARLDCTNTTLKDTPIKNIHYCCIYQATGISFRASNNQPVICDFCTVLPVCVLLPTICVLLKTKSNSGKIQTGGSLTPYAGDDQQTETSIKRNRPVRRVMRERLSCRYSFARFEPV